MNSNSSTKEEIESYKDSDARDDFLQAWSLVGEGLTILGINETIQEYLFGLYMSAVSKHLNVQKRYGFSRDATTINSCFFLAIKKYLQVDEDEILLSMQNVGVSEEDSRQLIIFLNNQVLLKNSYAAKKLLVQAKIFQLFGDIEILNQVPFREIWKFMIDGKDREGGSYIFENQPGYILGALNGFLFALQTKSNEKNMEWYISLHDIIVENTCGRFGKLDEVAAAINSKQLKENNQLSIDQQKEYFYHPTKLGLSNKPIIISKHIRDDKNLLFGFSIAHYTKDDLGIQDLKNKRQKWLLFGDNMVTLLKKTTQELEDRLKDIFEGFHQLLNISHDKADKLMAFLWLARELEIHHFFHDANGRVTIIILLSACASDPEIFPMFFFDPNILDGNSPASLSLLAIEAMQNAVQMYNVSNQSIELLHSIEEFKILCVEKFHDKAWPFIHSKTGLDNIYIKPFDKFTTV